MSQCGKIFLNVSFFTDFEKRFSVKSSRTPMETPEFLGVQEATIDSKGRLAIPAKFRDTLSAFDSGVLYATLKAKTHLLLYPASQWQIVKSEELPKMNESSLLRGVANLMKGNAEKINPDGSWRILIPPRLRSLTDFSDDKDVIFVGNDNHLEIWSIQAWDAQMANTLSIAPEDLEAALAEHNVRI